MLEATFMESTFEKYVVSVLSIPHVDLVQIFGKPALKYFDLHRL